MNKQEYEETIIKLTSYQKEALRTAFYPNFGNNILYPIVALFEEVGELCEKLEIVKYEDLDQKATKERHLEIIKELGDILWYSAMVYHELGEEFSFKLEKTFMTPFKLFLKTSKIAGIIKKSQRDNNGELTDEKRKELLELLDFVLSFVHNVAYQIDFNIREVCSMNIEKIDDRIKRGTLSGEGDNR